MIFAIAFARGKVRFVVTGLRGASSKSTVQYISFVMQDIAALTARLSALSSEIQQVIGHEDSAKVKQVPPWPFVVYYTALHSNALHCTALHLSIAGYFSSAPWFVWFVTVSGAFVAEGGLSAT